MHEPNDKNVMIASPMQIDGQVVQFHRKPFDGAFSIEGLFDTIRGEMHRQGCHPVVRQLPYFSRGLIPRWRNLFWAKQHQGTVNHITGDIHFIALGLDPRKTILTVHDLEILRRLVGIRRWLVHLFWFSLPLRRARFITVISKATQDDLIARYPGVASKVHIIPDVVDPCFVPYPYYFHSELPSILHIGTKSNKNLPRLIEALRGLQVCLRVVGALSQEHHAAIKKNGVVVDNLVNLTAPQLVQAYRDADIVCFASTSEGFGMPILEAQFVERPLITSNISSMPEVAGDGALFCNPFEVNSLREAILRVLQEPQLRESLIVKGRQNRERFSLSRIASQYLNLYARVSNVASNGRQV